MAMRAFRMDLDGCRALVALLVVLPVACGDAPEAAPSSVPGVVATAPSRSGAPGPSVRSVPALGSVPNDTARKQILAHVPADQAALASSSLLGTDTGEAEPDGGVTLAASPKDSAATPESHVSMVVRPARSSSSIEKLLRATVYFQLVDRCRDASHAILPPEAVVLGFEIDAGGAIIDGTIKAQPKDPKHEQAAECMIRELAASSFRAPAAAKGESTSVTMPVPSVD